MLSVLLARARQNGTDGWESWDDAPDTPRVNGTPAATAAAVDDWRGDVQSLAASLRVGQSSFGSSDGSDWDSYYDEEKERCFLVGVQLKQQRSKHGYGVQESIEELGRLADTAGLEVVGSTYQMLDEVNPRTYIGSGKVQEIMSAVANTGATTVIFDDELSPGQLRNLEKALGESVRLCDRTALILDIFSQRAATREGKLQVELAQSEYQLPRLTRMWTHLERQSGSGQVKGMGEKQIEVDRRLLKGRMARLRRDIEEVRTHRRTYRDRRAAAPIPVVALVGYTNAGKSTLLNTLTNAGVLAEDKLFATLDPTTRRVELAGGKAVLFTDTVGFIQKLPTQLVAAFRATLEEIQDASLLLHVVDVSHPNAPAQIDAVNRVLEELGVQNIPTLNVWNKVDACADPAVIRAVAARREQTVCISGLTGEGLEELLEKVSGKLQDSMVSVHVLVPYSQGELVDEIHRTGVVASAEFGGTGVELRAHVPLSLAQRLQPLRAQTAAAAEAAAANGAADDDEDEESLLDDGWSEEELALLEEEEAAAAAAAAGER
ncbi:GTP-binding hflX isoform A [Chlorella sorokiniana]|uniref:GTP-binding hflX isoform A n=1 Tax=Chlorella sorokiniana TaxID=3076 RepID=A0A2P6TGY1_CHLSO|nr:GTP-binding hflX isoform A [Chlorella sorokiniana]|eukprot:PRW33541.1 GTP-binding hflX isoform A [Chlorella sorokiniana]